MFEQVKQLIAEQLFVSPDEVKKDSDLKNDFNADSVDMMQMLITMEKTFGKTFSDEDLKAIKTVQDVVDFLEKK